MPKLETCRACRDETLDRGEWDSPVPEADFILWGKLFPKEYLGPRCYTHTAEAIGHGNMGRISQYAIFDLRPIRKALTEPAGLSSET